MKITLFTWQFWQGALARAMRTFAQGALAAQTGTSLDFWHLDWKAVLGMGLNAAWFSLLMSVDRSGGEGSQFLPSADDR